MCHAANGWTIALDRYSSKSYCFRAPFIILQMAQSELECALRYLIYTVLGSKLLRCSVRTGPRQSCNASPVRSPVVGGAVCYHKAHRELRGGACTCFHFNSKTCLYQRSCTLRGERHSSFIDRRLLGNACTRSESRLLI
jgi:hypothetical protein